MNIQGTEVFFPGTRLRLHTHPDANLTAQLFSNDPPEALRPGYAGNSFYFDIALDVPEISGLPQATWIHKSPTSEPAETQQGIFLDGDRRHLQPLDVRAEFEPLGDGQLTVWLSGQFLWVDTRKPADSPCPIVVVRASLLTVPEGK